MEQEIKTMTAQEAARAFLNAGLSEPTFRRRVADGKIEKIGKAYSEEDVIKVINQALEKRAKSKNPKVRNYIVTSTQFLKASIEDMPEIALLIGEAFGSFPNVERWQAWMEANEDIAYILRCQGEIVGCGFIMPLTEEKILDILNNEVTPVTTPEEIGAFRTGQPVNLYVRTVAVKQKGVNRKLSMLWGKRLILAMQNLVVRFGTQGIIINRLYSRSDTNQGRRTLRLLGFTEIPTNTSHHNFMIDVSSSGLTMIHRYKDALNQWKIKYEDA